MKHCHFLLAACLLLSTPSAGAESKTTPATAEKSAKWLQSMMKHGEGMPALMARMEKGPDPKKALVEVNALYDEAMLLGLEARTLPSLDGWREKARQSFQKSLNLEGEALQIVKHMLEKNTDTELKAFTDKSKAYRASFEEGRVLMLTDGKKEFPRATAP